MLRALLLCFLCVSFVRAETPPEMFDFGIPKPALASLDVDPVIAIVEDPIVLPPVATAGPLREALAKFRARQSILINFEVETLAQKSFLERVQYRLFSRRQGRLRAAANFATTGVNTRLQNLSFFFPRALFNLR